jgi:phosphoserine phosphatase
MVSGNRPQVGSVGADSEAESWASLPMSTRCDQDGRESVALLANLPRQSLFEIAKRCNVPADKRLTMTREELIDAIRRTDI